MPVALYLAAESLTTRKWLFGVMRRTDEWSGAHGIFRSARPPALEAVRAALRHAPLTTKVASNSKSVSSSDNEG